MSTLKEIRPQPGPQLSFLSSAADIVIYGGSAGGGKSWSLLLEVLRGVHNPAFNTVLFRRSFPMIRNPGGLWDASCQIFPLVGAYPKETKLTWEFPSGAVCVMRHLKLESNVYDWQGSEIVYIGFDELTHFTESQFWYMLSRNRSTCGISPFVRATCNPDSDSWVRGLIDWWIGPDGLAIPERSGTTRHFIRRDGEIVWLDEPDSESKSLCFISASIYDNKALLEKDPGYLNNLKSLPLVERERLLGGNWNVKAVAGKVFRPDWFIPQLSVISHQSLVKTVRFWDFASSAEENKGNDPDCTTNVKMGLLPNGGCVILEALSMLGSPGEVERSLLQTAQQDGYMVQQRWQRDPGQAGVYQDQKLRSLLRGYDAMGIPSQISKYERAKPFSRAAEFGQVQICDFPAKQAFLNELAQYPDGPHDDYVDAGAGAYNSLYGSASLGSSSTGNYRS
jgi:predicted phage terminase large subunit-like protein